MRALYLSITVMFLITLRGFGQESIDFESLTLDAIYMAPNDNPGDTIGNENGISLVLDNFEDLSGNQRFLNVQVRNANQEDFIHGQDNILFLGGGIRFDFSSVPDGVKSVYFFYKQNDGLIKNLSINGESHKALSFENFPKDWSNGVKMKHSFYQGTTQGVVRIMGDIQELIIAGEALEIDHISYNTTENISVYPGDCNNDGRCNYLDLLNIGLAIDKAGAPRNDDGNNWEPNDGILWTKSVSPNLAYADVDGNGLINSEDYELYKSMHLGKTHPGLNTEEPTYVEGEPSEDFTLFFAEEGGDENDTIPYDQNASREPFNLAVYMTPGNSSDTIYGISWIWRINTLSFDVANPAFEYLNSQLGTTNVDLLTILDTSRVDQGIIGCTMVRNDGNNAQVTEQIKLGTFNGIIVDLKGFKSSDNEIEIDSIRGIDNLGEPVPVHNLDNRVFFSPFTDLQENPFNPQDIIVYPNPLSDKNIKLSISQRLIPEISNIRLLNNNGQLLFVEEKVDQLTSIYNNNLPAGNYYVEVRFGKYQSLIYKIQLL